MAKIDIDKTIRFILVVLVIILIFIMGRTYEQKRRYRPATTVSYITSNDTLVIILEYH